MSQLKNTYFTLVRVKVKISNMAFDFKEMKIYQEKQNIYT